MDRTVRTVEDVLTLLDGLFARQDGRLTTGDGAEFWDGFYADRSRPVPFFVAKPDESLASYLDQGLIAPGRALDLGCGPGRNALFLASRGFEVDAVDLSPAGIAWAEDRAREVGAEVRFVCGDAFRLTGAVPAGTAPADAGTSGAGTADAVLGGAAVGGPALTGPYDLIVDSGCLHHLPPHRRVSYLALLDRVLAPGGHLALTCFAAGAMGSELSDTDLYPTCQLQGGLAYTPESLRWIFSDLTEVELRRMRDEPPESPLFGEAFLWTALFRRDPGRASG
ncbi:class I SAM-dependent methyltransferase [Kitasatospora sp. NBC_01287]|uniref:class I SAM-dependent methyltransferase n=1 Tax=Kitasatospora sp. NBC_01287 TaxID=2903573 RepID=UPI00224CB257|nr:class I SAM-dependent methyltransferase [Kitasatospora sp. NBC_01287]MCX4745319.1 class I SAM-dependent methyltransferase [Kitasatospora sp. NBC_01287]